MENGTTTANLNLLKPAEDDYVEVEDINTNMDTIDGAIQADRDRIGALEEKATSVSVEQVKTSGIEIAKITVDGETKSIYQQDNDVAVAVFNQTGITDADRPILASHTDVTTTAGANNWAARYSTVNTGVTLNPKTGVVTAPKFKGDLEGNADTATSATNVSATAGTADASRHVWFSDSSSETLRAYDGDFTYNPSSNELRIGNASSAGLLTLWGKTQSATTWDDSVNNAKIMFNNGDKTQGMSIVYNDYDTYQKPASISILGKQGGEYLIAPNIKATGKFYGALEGTADKVAHTLKITQDNGVQAEFDGSADVTVTGVNYAAFAYYLSNKAGSTVTSRNDSWTGGQLDASDVRVWSQGWVNSDYNTDWGGISIWLHKESASQTVANLQLDGEVYTRKGINLSNSLQNGAIAEGNNYAVSGGQVYAALTGKQAAGNYAKTDASNTFGATTTQTLGHAQINGTLLTKGEIEIFGVSPHLDFHYDNNSTVDNTSRIIETASGTLNVNGSSFSTTATALAGAVTATGGLTIKNMTWQSGGNILLNATANNNEWSFDIARNGKTGCYWHVWDSSLGSMLRVNADDGKVIATRAMDINGTLTTQATMVYKNTTINTVSTGTEGEAPAPTSATYIFSPMVNLRDASNRTVGWLERYDSTTFQGMFLGARQYHKDTNGNIVNTHSRMGPRYDVAKNRWETIIESDTPDDSTENQIATARWTYAKFLPKAGGTISGNLTLAGNLTINGSTYETHAEQIYSKKDYVILREGATGGLASGAYSGFEFVKYDGTNNGRLVVDSTGTARVGDTGSEQPLLTRNESSAMTEGQILSWDAANLKAVTSGELTHCISIKQSARPSGEVYNDLTGIQVKRTDSSGDVGLGVGTGGVNHGVYSNTLKKWMVYANASQVFLQGRAETFLTGTATNINGTKRPIYFTGADSANALLPGRAEYEGSTTNPFAYDNNSETLFVHYVNEGGTLLSDKYYPKSGGALTGPVTGPIVRKNPIYGLSSCNSNTSNPAAAIYWWKIATVTATKTTNSSAVLNFAFNNTYRSMDIHIWASISNSGPKITGVGAICTSTYFDAGWASRIYVVWISDTVAEVWVNSGRTKSDGTGAPGTASYSSIIPNYAFSRGDYHLWDYCVALQTTDPEWYTQWLAKIADSSYNVTAYKAIVSPVMDVDASYVKSVNGVATNLTVEEPLNVHSPDFVDLIVRSNRATGNIGGLEFCTDNTFDHCRSKVYGHYNGTDGMVIHELHNKDNAVNYMYFSYSGLDISTDMIMRGDRHIKNIVDDSLIRIQGGSAERHGGRLVVSGKDRSARPGNIEMVGDNGTDAYTLRVTPTGIWQNDGSVRYICDNISNATTPSARRINYEPRRSIENDTLWQTETIQEANGCHALTIATNFHKSTPTTSKWKYPLKVVEYLDSAGVSQNDLYLGTGHTTIYGEAAIVEKNAWMGFYNGTYAKDYTSTNEVALGQNLVWVTKDWNTLVSLSPYIGTTSYNYLRFNVADKAGALQWGMNLLSNGRLHVNTEIAAVNCLSSGGQFRASSTNRDFIIRNDNSDTYFLLTNEKWGFWNSLRPFRINNTTGLVTMENGVNTTSGTLTWKHCVWTEGGNITCSAANNSAEWSFDISRNGHTGTYWHVWDSEKGSMLGVSPDDGVVHAHFGFSCPSSAPATSGFKNITASTSGPSGGNNGDVWIQY